MQFMLLFSRQGKLRLQKWYVAHQDKLKKKITRELITTILARKPKMCSFLEWKDCKIVYKRCVHIDFMFHLRYHTLRASSRYASLYFCCAVEQNDNELLTLEIIHRYVELLDKYFGSVSWTIKFLFPVIHNKTILGVRAWHHLQLREGLFHPRRVAGWRGDSGDVEEERAESDRGAGRASRGW